MRNTRSLIAAALSLLVLAFSICSPAVFAATATKYNTPGQALELAPPLITLTANPGQTLKPQIMLRDITTGDLIVTNEINDFVANGEDGTPKILTGDDSNNPFQLKGWISPLPSFTLSPSQTQTLTLAINVPKNASPGGHYGVIRFTGIPAQLKTTGVSLSASIGALVLLTVNGNLTHQLSTTQFAPSKDGIHPASLFQSVPLSFITRIRNSGNIQEEPTGQIIITDMFGKNVGAVNVNAPPRNILPDSIRSFPEVLTGREEGNKRLFGLYHAKLDVVYGDNNDKTLVATTIFWVIPYKLIGIIILLLIIAFFIIRYLLQRYKKKIVRQTTHSRSSKQPTKRRRM